MREDESVALQRIKRECGAFGELKVRNMIGKVKQQQGIYLKGQLGSSEGHSGKSIAFIYFEKSLCYVVGRLEWG